MKLLLILIYIVIEISYSIKVNLALQEQLMKSMSVFDVIETDKSSAPTTQGPPQPIPQQNPQANIPPQAQGGPVIPGAPGSDPSASQAPSLDTTQTNEQSQVPDPTPPAYPEPAMIPPQVSTPVQPPVYTNPSPTPIVRPVQAPRPNVEQIIEKIKDKVSNPYLKANFTLPNIANFFANFISGNEYLNNLQVKEKSEFKKAEVSEVLTVKKKANIKTVEFKNLRSRVMNITQNEIVFDPNTVLKMKNSKIAFKVKDIFEVIAFMKYILRLCGTKLEKCDFSNLLSVNKTEEIVQILSFIHNNQIKSQNHTNTNNATINKTSTNNSSPIIKNTFLKKNDLRNDYKFKQKTDLDFEKVEKELKLDLGSRVPVNQDVSLDTDYLNFMENPSMEQYLNNYYYSSGTNDMSDTTGNI